MKRLAQPLAGARRGATRRQLPAVFRQRNAIDLNREEMIMTQHGRRWGCASLFVLVGWLLVSLLCLLGVPVYALEPLLPYDDFNAAHIDPDKWWSGGIYAGLGTETIRQIQDNRVRLFYRGYGNTDSDSWGVFNGLGLTFRNYAAVTAIKATVQVNDVVATACASNPKVTFPGGIYPWIGAWAGPQGHFFNTAAPTPGSMENDVVAGISMFRASDSTDPPDVLRVQSVVLHCARRFCDTTLHHKDLGPVKRGEMARLRIQWDRDNHRFIFQRDDAPEVVAPYTVSDTGQPSAAVKRLVVANEVANCTSMPRPVAFIDALFDDVMVNESAAPRGAR
jgi:hypothetical protein